jgi:hypothetical protein
MRLRAPRIFGTLEWASPFPGDRDERILLEEARLALQERPLPT